nr:hypothetical protein CFP56_19417 [Quercus suber]
MISGPPYRHRGQCVMAAGFLIGSMWRTLFRHILFQPASQPARPPGLRPLSGLRACAALLRSLCSSTAFPKPDRGARRMGSTASVSAGNTAPTDDDDDAAAAAGGTPTGRRRRTTVAAPKRLSDGSGRYRAWNDGRTLGEGVSGWNRVLVPTVEAPTHQLLLEWARRDPDEGSHIAQVCSQVESIMTVQPVHWDGGVGR